MEENKNIPQPNMQQDSIKETIQVPQESVNKNDVLPEVNNIKSQETYTLPSKGILYDPKDNIPASITLRRMTTREDKIRMRNISDNEIRKQLLQACVMENIDVGKLKIQDANFLLFRLRALSLLNDKYKVYCRCPHCNTEFVDELNLLEVPIKYIKETDLKEFKIQLPMSKQNIDFKYPSLDNIITMGQSLRDYLDRYPNADINEELYTASAVLYIDKINNNKPLLEELEEWMDNLDIVDSRALKDIIAKLDDLYGFVEDIKTRCPSCQQEVTHGLPITSELFTPSN